MIPTHRIRTTAGTYLTAITSDEDGATLWRNIAAGHAIPTPQGDVWPNRDHVVAVEKIRP